MVFEYLNKQCSSFSGNSQLLFPWSFSLCPLLLFSTHSSVILGFTSESLQSQKWKDLEGVGERAESLQERLWCCCARGSVKFRAGRCVGSAGAYSWRTFPFKRSVMMKVILLMIMIIVIITIWIWHMTFPCDFYRPQLYSRFIHLIPALIKMLVQFTDS